MLRTLRKLLGTSGTEDKVLREADKAVRKASAEMDRDDRSTTEAENEDNTEESVKPYEVQKREKQKKKGRVHKRTEQGYNDEFDGCSSCSRNGLSIQWISISPDQQAKSIECEYCGSIFKEQIIKTNSGKDIALREVDSIDDLEPVSSAMTYELKKYLRLRL